MAPKQLWGWVMSISTQIVAARWTYEEVAGEYRKQVAMNVFTDVELVDQLVLRTGLGRRVVELVIDRELFNNSVTVGLVELGPVE